MSSQTDTLRKLLKSTEKSAAAAQTLVGEFMTKGKAQAESMMSMVEAEVEKQLARIGIATSTDIAKLEARIDALTAKAPAAKSATAKPAAKPVVKAPVAKKVAKKAAAVKAPVAKKVAAVKKAVSTK